MKIAVVDDEKIWVEKIKIFLKRFYGKEKIEIIGYLSGEGFLDENIEFDIVLMDIEMPGIDGFEAIELYKSRFPETVIIILTTHDELARKGFIFEAFRYIDKLSMEKELPEALKSAARKLNYDKTISLHVLNWSEVTIKIRDIIYIETIKRNIIVHTRFESLICGNLITEMEQKLSGEGFYRVHRSYLINLKCVESFSNTDIKMCNGDYAMLSSRKYKNFKKYLMEYRYCMANG